MKYLKRYICIVVILVISTSCSNEKSPNPEPSENFLNTLESTPPESEETNSDDLFPIPSGFQHTANILDSKGEGFSLTTVTYTGKHIRFDLISAICRDDEKAAEEYDITLFILIDGNLQPYYFNNANTTVNYTLLRVKPSTQEEKYNIAFDPIYVPHKEKACVSVVMAIADHKYYENPNTQNNACVSELNFRITADTPKHQVRYEKKENRYNTRSNMDAKGEPSSFVLTEKLTDPKKQFRINTAFETKGPLYLYQFMNKLDLSPDDTSYQISDVRLFYIVDGKLVKPFKGKYYYDLKIKYGQLYEIPLDMSIFKKGERHLAYAFSVDNESLKSINTKGFDNDRSFNVCGSASFCYNIMVK